MHDVWKSGQPDRDQATKAHNPFLCLMAQNSFMPSRWRCCLWRGAQTTPQTNPKGKFELLRSSPILGQNRKGTHVLAKVLPAMDRRRRSGNTVESAAASDKSCAAFDFAPNRFRNRWEFLTKRAKPCPSAFLESPPEERPFTSTSNTLQARLDWRSVLSMTPSLAWSLQREK